MSDSLQPHGLQHVRLPCPSLYPRVCSNLCAWSQWCHPTFSSSVTLFSSCPQSFPASGSFPVSWLFASGSQNIVTSTLASLNMPPKLVKKQKGQSWKRICWSSNASVRPPTSHIPRKSHQPMTNSGKVVPRDTISAAFGPILNLGWGRPRKRPAYLCTQSRNCYMLCQY